MTTLLDRILRDPPPAYAILHRPHSTSPGQLDILTGSVTHPATLARIPPAKRTRVSLHFGFQRRIVIREGLRIPVR